MLIIVLVDQVRERLLALLKICTYYQLYNCVIFYEIERLNDNDDNVLYELFCFFVCLFFKGSHYTYKCSGCFYFHTVFWCFIFAIFLLWFHFTQMRKVGSFKYLFFCCTTIRNAYRKRVFNKARSARLSLFWNNLLECLLGRS